MVVLLESSHISIEELWSSSPPIAQFGWATSCRKSFGCSKHIPFNNDGGHCVLGDLQCCRHFLYHSPELCLGVIQSRNSTDNSFDLMAWFLLRHALSTVGPYIDRCVPFQIMYKQLNSPRVDSNQNCRNLSRMINRTRMHRSSISRLIAKGLNTFATVANIFTFSLLGTVR